MEHKMPGGLGARPSAPDQRDIKEEHVALAAPYPTTFNGGYQGNIGVTMQNKIGICTANLCYLMERLLQKKGINVKLSRRFLYTVVKQIIEKDASEGAQLRDVLKAAYTYGVALESTVPTDTTVSHADFIKEYNWPQAVWDEAYKYSLGGFISYGVDKDSLCRGMSQYGGLYARMEVGSEWWTPSWAEKDIEPLRPPQSVISGHAIVLTDYDASQAKTKETLINSWSVEWARKGFCDFLLEDYAPHLTEAWAITLDPLVMPFLTDIKMGDKSSDVKNLQIALKIKGFFTYPVITGYFGTSTLTAVKLFQKAYGINQTGYVGPITRAQLNRIFQ